MKRRRPFTRAQEVFAWIEGFTNFERVPSSTRAFRLDRMETLAELAGHPERCAPVFHVAGSKGKGSVSTILASLLQKGGYRVGRYLSPHVSDYRERISLPDRFFDDALYGEAGTELYAIAEEASHRYPDLFDSSREQGAPPTFFELCTLLFFLCCRKAQVEMMVVEVGMGGRLDATNIVDPLVSLITPIELEHTAYLGTTLSAIAGEKGGIIKPHRPVVVSPQDPEALEVLEAIAQNQNSPLFLLSEGVNIQDLRLGPEGTSWSTTFTGHPWPLQTQGATMSLRIPLVGDVHSWNTLQALAALYVALPEKDWLSLLGSLTALFLPARFERVARNPDIIIDGAHTPRSITYCLTTFQRLYGDGNVLLFGCAVDKDVETMAAILAPHFKRVVLTRPGTFKTSDLDRTRGAFEKAGLSPLVIPTTDEALAEAHRCAQGKALLVCGSFYLAAEVRKHLHP